MERDTWTGNWTQDDWDAAFADEMESYAERRGISLESIHKAEQMMYHRCPHCPPPPDGSLNNRAEVEPIVVPMDADGSFIALLAWLEATVAPVSTGSKVLVVRCVRHDYVVWRIPIDALQKTLDAVGGGPVPSLAPK